MSDDRHEPPVDPGRLRLEDIDSTRWRIPSSTVKLSAQERQLLSDAEWINEDEADLIMALRVERTQESSAIPFEEYLRKRGRRLERYHPS